MKKNKDSKEDKKSKKSKKKNVKNDAEKSNKKAIFQSKEKENFDVEQLPMHRRKKMNIDKRSYEMSKAMINKKQKETIEKLRKNNFQNKMDLKSEDIIAEIKEEKSEDLGIFGNMFKNLNNKNVLKETILNSTCKYFEIGSIVNQKSWIDLNDITDILDQKFDENDYDNISSFGASRNKSMNRSVMSKSMMSNSVMKGSIKKKNFNQSLASNSVLNVSESRDDNYIINTCNSYLRKELVKKVEINSNVNSRIKMYKEAIHKYEGIVINSICQSYQRKLSQGKENEKHSSFYEELMNNKNKYLGKYGENIEKQMKDFKSFTSYCKYYIDIKLKSYDTLEKFYKSLSDTITKDNAESKNEQNYIKWKSKISELLNTLDLFESNGIKMKIGIKYIPFKRLLSLRSKKLNSFKNNKVKKEENNALDKLLSIKLPGLSEEKKGEIDEIPSALFRPDDQMTTILIICVSIANLYNFFTFPYRLILPEKEANSNVYINLDNLTSIVYFIDVVCTSRSSYMDKYNNEVFDIKKILVHYLNDSFLPDILAAVPWKIFFIWNKRIYNILSFLILFKIFSLGKLSNLLTKLEEFQSANYVRMFRLLLICFVLVHWLCIVIYTSLNNSFRWDINSQSCFHSNNYKVRTDLNNGCAYVFSLGSSVYFIPGSFNKTIMNLTSQLNSSGEHLILTFMLLIGSILSAYIFGGMTNIMQNLNQGQNIITDKIDILRSHMEFYEIDETLQDEIQCYYDYIWQRHKDKIYGKHQFKLLSKSLREKFETMNLPGNEIYLKLFYLLGNKDLVNEILLQLNKYIAFPNEIVFSEGSLIEGLYFLINGEITLVSEMNPQIKKVNYKIRFFDVIEQMDSKKKSKNIGEDLSKPNENENDDFIESQPIFPLLSVFLKTGRTYQKCYCHNFTDLLWLKLDHLETLIKVFPIEMHTLKHKLFKWVESKKLFENENVFKSISRHSARSVGSYYQKTYDFHSIWVPIPIPISQRKIAKNYIQFFLNKINYLHKEILTCSDLNICLKSNYIVSSIKNEVIKDYNTTTKNKGNLKSKENDKGNNLLNIPELNNLVELIKEVEEISDDLHQFKEKFNVFLHKDDESEENQNDENEE